MYRLEPGLPVVGVANQRLHGRDHQQGDVLLIGEGLVLFKALMLGVSPSTGYELMHKKDFPILKIGNRIVVPKEKFIAWLEQKTGGAKR